MKQVSRNPKRSVLRWRLAGCVTGGLGLGLSILLVGWLFYYGWCWGWWGKNAPLLQYLFQCRCPPASEAVRYKPFKVLVSACVYPKLVDISPGGRYIVVIKNEPAFARFRLDLVTGETLSLDLTTGAIKFLNDDLLLVSLPDDVYRVWDLKDNIQTTLPIAKHRYKQPLDETVLQYLRRAEQVILVYPRKIVVLAPNYRDHPDQNLVIETEDEREIVQILRDEGIPFDEPPFPSPGAYELQYSHDGKFRADVDGIHLSQTEQLIVSTGQLPPSPGEIWYGFGPQGWVQNDQVAVYGYGGIRYVIESTGWSAGLFDYLPFPRPILLLEMPPQYWVTPMPEP